MADAVINGTVSYLFGALLLFLMMTLGFSPTSSVLWSLGLALTLFVVLHILWFEVTGPELRLKTVECFVDVLQFWPRSKRILFLVVVPLVIGVATTVISFKQFVHSPVLLLPALAIFILSSACTFWVLLSVFPIRVAIARQFFDFRLSLTVLVPLLLAVLAWSVASGYGLALVMVSLFLGSSLAVARYESVVSSAIARKVGAVDGVVEKPQQLLEREIWAGHILRASLILRCLKLVGMIDERRALRADVRIAFRRNLFPRVIELSEQHLRAQTEQPPSFVVRSLYAQALLRTAGREEEAKKILKDAIGEAPGLGFLKVSLSYYLWAMGKLDDAIEMAEEVINDLGAIKCPAAVNNLAFFLCEKVIERLTGKQDQEEREQVLACADTLVREALAEGNVAHGIRHACYDTLGLVYALQGRIKEAESMFFMSSEFGRPSALVTFHMAVCATINTRSYRRAQTLLVLARRELQKECLHDTWIPKRIERHATKVNRAQELLLVLDESTFLHLDSDHIPVSESEPSIAAISWSEALGRVVSLIRRVPAIAFGNI